MVGFACTQSDFFCIYKRTVAVSRRKPRRHMSFHDALQRASDVKRREFAARMLNSLGESDREDLFSRLPMLVLREFLTNDGSALINPGKLAVLSPAMRDAVSRVMASAGFWHDLSVTCFPLVRELAPDSQRLLVAGAYGEPGSIAAHNAAWRAQFQRILETWDNLIMKSFGTSNAIMHVKQNLADSGPLITCTDYTAPTCRTFPVSGILSPGYTSVIGIGLYVYGKQVTTRYRIISTSPRVQELSLGEVVHLLDNQGLLTVTVRPRELTMNDLEKMALPIRDAILHEPEFSPRFVSVQLYDSGRILHAEQMPASYTLNKALAAFGVRLHPNQTAYVSNIQWVEHLYLNLATTIQGEYRLGEISLTDGSPIHVNVLP